MVVVRVWFFERKKIKRSLGVGGFGMRILKY